MTMPGRKYAAASSSYRYGFNGQMKDDEISEAGNSYTAEFWQYDSRLGRRWNQDPKPLPSVSNYACFANNPIFFADPKGDTAAVFKPDGSFWKFQDDGKKEWSGMLYQNSKVTGTKTANGTTSTYYEYSNPLTFQFNDAAVDVLALKNGVASNGAVGITRVEVMSDASVEKQIIRSGVRDANAQNSPMSYAKKQGANKMDYGVQGILTGDLKSNTFYVRGKTAYNVGDIGNYLWGKGMGELKIDHLTAKAGAHYNNIFNGRKQKTPMYDFGPGTYGSPGFWDSPGDQRAIRAGYMTTPFYWQQEQEAEKELKRLENNMKYGPKF